MGYAYTAHYLDTPPVSHRAFDLFAPKDLTQDIALFFVHGGGWEGGSRTGYHEFMYHYAQEGFLSATIDYRLIFGQAQSVWDQITDVRHAYDAFISELKILNRPLNVCVFGCSAGAHLAALLSWANPGACGESDTFGNYHLQNEWVPPKGVVLQSTPVYFELWEDIFPHLPAKFKALTEASFEEAPEKYKQVSPAHHLTPNTCPTFFMEAETEHLFPTRLVDKAMDKMNALGVRTEKKLYKNAEHGFFFALNRWQQKEAYEDLKNFALSLT